MLDCTPAICETSDLVIAFVNTRDPETLGEWLTGRAGEPVEAADTTAAAELRAQLVVLLRSHADCIDDPAAVPAAQAYLRRIARRYPLVPIITADGCTLSPAQDGVLGVFGQVLAAVTDLAYRGVWARVKVCKNGGCHRGFFDKTRNTSGLYCSAACGSQAAMRAYRSRRSAA